MKKKKGTVISVWSIILCQSAFCQAISRQTFLERETPTEICKIDDITFYCHYHAWEDGENYRFILKSKEQTAEVIFTSEKNHHELSGYYLNNILCLHESSKKQEIIKYPYKVFIFNDNILSFTFSDLKKIGGQVYNKFCYLDCEDTEETYQNFSYLVREYAKNRQLKSRGRESSPFSKGFDFELGEGKPYGDWLILKDTVIKSVENLSNNTICQLNNYCWNFSNEEELLNGTIKWTMTMSELKCLFSPNEKQSFYFKVNINPRPYILHIIQHDATTERKIEHLFSANGDISEIIDSDKVRSVKYRYEEQGFLSSKISWKVLNPFEIKIKTYDIDKEYESIIIPSSK